MSTIDKTYKYVKLKFELRIKKSIISSCARGTNGPTSEKMVSNLLNSFSILWTKTGSCYGNCGSISRCSISRLTPIETWFIVDKR